MEEDGPRPNWLNRLVMAVASTRPGAWLLAPILHHVDRAVLWLTGGRFTASSLLAGIPTIILTAKGARSGKRRSVPLLGVPAGNNGDKSVAGDEGDAGDIVVIASSWGQERHPAWYYNVRANPEVEVSWDGGGGRYLAREATGAERERYWQKAVAIYPGFAAYRRRTDRQIPVIVLSPIGRPTGERA